jgi:hypothetical protein
MDAYDTNSKFDVLSRPLAEKSIFSLDTSNSLHTNTSFYRYFFVTKLEKAFLDSTWKTVSKNMFEQKTFSKKFDLEGLQVEREPKGSRGRIFWKMFLFKYVFRYSFPC